MKSMALYDERKAFYDTKTTCFAVMGAFPFILLVLMLLC